MAKEKSKFNIKDQLAGIAALIAAIVAIGTRIPVPWPNIQKYLNTIKFSDKNIYTGCTGLRRRQDSPTPTRRPSELAMAADMAANFYQP